ncbi:MAG: RluA family pseudouridine synthase, partial [Planctomycetes bacterium]|nr:RluA family pseudouridine synthase [Planctomycetota bacterium]
MPSSQQLDVLYEDNHLLVVNKPAMLPTMGVASSRPSLLSVAKQYIADKFDKSGNVYLGVVSRLDAPVTGVVLLARTSKAASRLTAAFRNREVQKVYWAVVSGTPDPPQGTLEHYLRKDDRHRKMHVTNSGAADAKLARLTYEVRAERSDCSLVEVQLETGRKHQIRVQLAKLGHPVVGDRKYGSGSEFPLGIALHSRRLQIEHPVGKQPMQFEAPVPVAWSKHAVV